ncbi:MAG: hypothetical protein MUE50_18815 [Pirellulaceae bacterium]|nr:hypothetical protein [Pirellulaceae bacterium]MCU0981679.1 hypothetical protein [Pirellulaceae bacterium]
MLCPGGTAITITTDNERRITDRFVKPRPREIDDWTHYLYDAGGNAVSLDTVVAPPRHLQWVGSPAWTRNHDHMSSFTAMVSAGGRVFYIVDEGLRAEIQLPSKWMLIARDAFNGTIPGLGTERRVPWWPWKPARGRHCGMHRRPWCR